MIVTEEKGVWFLGVFAAVFLEIDKKNHPTFLLKAGTDIGVVHAVCRHWKFKSGEFFVNNIWYRYNFHFPRCEAQIMSANQ